MKVNRYSLVLLVLFLACARQVRKPEIEKPTALIFYQQGMVFLDKGENEKAKALFNKAVQDQPNAAEGYAGLALVQAEEQRYDQAMQYAKRAIKKQPTAVAALMAMARVLTLSSDDPTDLNNAIDLLERAIDQAPQNDRLHYYQGLSYQKSQAYEKAIQSFIKAYAAEGPVAEKAQAHLQNLRHVSRLNPATKTSWKIGLKEAISRADLAYLFVEQLDLVGLLRKYRPHTEKNVDSITIRDVDQSHARDEIYLMVQLGIMDVYPDERFKPQKPVNRAHFAVLLQRLLVFLSRDKSIQGRYAGTSSTMADVPATHYAYNAIRVICDLEILSIDNSKFDPHKHVSGMTALSAMNRVLTVIKRI